MVPTGKSWFRVCVCVACVRACVRTRAVLPSPGFSGPKCPPPPPARFWPADMFFICFHTFFIRFYTFLVIYAQQQQPPPPLARTHARNANTNTKHDFPVGGVTKDSPPQPPIKSDHKVLIL